MVNRIDLSKYNIRTDLLIESINDKKNLKYKKINDNISVSEVVVDDKISSDIIRKKGIYITIEFRDITNYEDRVVVSDVFIKELKKY